MGRLINAFQTKIVFLTLVFLTSICSQILYETDDQQNTILNRRSKEVSAKSTLDETEAFLKKKTSSLQICIDNEDAYYDSLIFNSQRQTPSESIIDKICARHPDLIIKSTEDCHTYYNCSGVDTELSKCIPTFWPSKFKHLISKFKHECQYPFLFSEETMQCENYTEVNCSNRNEPTWECRYFRLACKRHNCKLCEQEYPTCEGKEDGLHPLPSDPYNSDYIRCDKGRRIEIGMCPPDPEWGTQEVPYNRQCVQVFAVPIDDHKNGQLPSCNGKGDGNYQFLVGYCRGYYRCDGGVATAVKCPNNTIFDTVKKSCEIGGVCITN